jgi:hypothetical protein
MKRLARHVLLASISWVGCVRQSPAPEAEASGCFDPPPSVFVRALHMATAVDTTLGARGRLVVRVAGGDSAGAPIASARVRASLLPRALGTGAERHLSEGRPGTYAEDFPAGPLELEVRAIRFTGYRDTIAVRGGYADTLDLRLLRTGWCF